MTVALVTGDSVFGRYLAASLAGAGAIDRVIVERPRLPPSYLIRKLASVGPVEMAFQYWLTRRFHRDGGAELPPVSPPAGEVTRDVNTIAFAPDELILAFGTSYVRRSTLRRLPQGILNLHTGLLPEYRGVKSEFWCRFNRDACGAGWTLHYMSEQLDAGDIVLRQVVPWTGETPGALRAKILRDAVPRLASFIANVRRGGRIERRPQGPGTYYSAPLLRQWRACRRLQHG